MTLDSGFPLLRACGELRTDIVEDSAAAVSLSLGRRREAAKDQGYRKKNRQCSHNENSFSPLRELVASHITFFRTLFPLDLFLLFLLLLRQLGGGRTKANPYHDAQNRCA